jgi:hypothetical protein
MRREEIDAGAGPSERPRQRVVIGRRVRRRVGEDDAHAVRLDE